MRSILTIILTATIIGQACGQQILAQAKSGDKWGYIDNKGAFVIKPIYEKCSGFTDDGLAAIYEKKRKSFYFIKPDGSELKSEVEKFKLASVFGFGTKGFSDGMAGVQVGKKWGYMNTEGKLVVEAKYDKALEFNGGVGVAKSGGNFYLIDKSGSESKVDIAGLQDVRRFSEGLAPYRANDQWGFINSTGEVVIKAQYKGIGYMCEGLAWTKSESGNVGFVDASGNMKIDAKYESAKDFNSGVAKVKSGSWSYVDRTGKEINAPSADSYGKFSDGMAYLKKNDKVGFIDVSGTLVVEPTYDKVRDFKNGLAAVRQGEKWGFIDKAGKMVIKPQFDAVKDFEATDK